MSEYSKTLYTHNYHGSIHVEDLLYLYEKIRLIVCHRFPDFKKIEPCFEISSKQGESKDLTDEKLEYLFSPDEMLSSCSFTLRLPVSGNEKHGVSSISFATSNQHNIHITAEGTDQQEVDALVNTIIYSINPYVSDMNIGRQPPVKHEERTYTIKTEPAKHDKPDGDRYIVEAPVIKANLSDAEREHPEKGSRKNSKYIIVGIIVIVLLIAIVIIIASLK